MTDSLTERFEAMDDDPMPVGELLTRELVTRGWTQVQFAEILGRPAQVVNEIIRGKKEITRETAAQIGAATGTSAGFWLHQQNRWNLQAQSGNQRLQGTLAAIRARAGSGAGLAKLRGHLVHACAHGGVSLGGDDTNDDHRGAGHDDPGG
jgi:addiction module HigA family antidote